MLLIAPLAIIVVLSVLALLLIILIESPITFLIIVAIIVICALAFKGMLLLLSKEDYIWPYTTNSNNINNK